MANRGDLNPAEDLESRLNRLEGDLRAMKPRVFSETRWLVYFVLNVLVLAVHASGLARGLQPAIFLGLVGLVAVAAWPTSTLIASARFNRRYGEAEQAIQRGRQMLESNQRQ